MTSDLYGPGYTSLAGATSCTPCPVGKFSAVTDNACSPCPVNSYTDELGTALCTPCALGKFSNSSVASCNAFDTSTCVGATMCTDCPVNTKRGLTDNDSDADTTIDASCVACPDDDPATDENEAKFAGSGSEICVDCPPGKYKPEGGSVCVECAAGKQQRNNGCEDCEVGR